MKNRLSFVNKTRALVFLTIVSLASLGGYVGFDQFGDYQGRLRGEGFLRARETVYQSILANCEQNIASVLQDAPVLTLTTQECVSAAFFDIVTERGELILRSDTGENILLVPII